MKSINVYLNFPGNSEEAMNFYKSIFGGKLDIMRYSEMPDNEKLSEDDKNKIMHSGLMLDNGEMIMASDSMEGFGDKLKEGNNFSINISAESKEEADKLFAKLSDGGKVGMKMEDAFWGSYFGMLTDKFGVQWLIGYDYPK